MSVAAPNTLKYVVMFFEKGKKGWQEKFYFKPGAIDPSTYIGPLVLARRMLLPAEATITYVHTSNPGGKRDSRPVYSTNLAGAAVGPPFVGLASSLTTPPATEPPVSTNVALVLKAYTLEGAWNNSFLRCLPNSIVANDALTITPAGLPSTFTTPATGDPVIATFTAALANYMRGILNLTVYASSRAPLYGGPYAAGTYDTEPWDTIITNGLKEDKKTGRPFKTPVGRVILR